MITTISVLAMGYFAFCFLDGHIKEQVKKQVEEHIPPTSEDIEFDDNDDWLIEEFEG